MRHWCGDTAAKATRDGSTRTLTCPYQHSFAHLPAAPSQPRRSTALPSACQHTTLHSPRCAQSSSDLWGHSKGDMRQDSSGAPLPRAPPGWAAASSCMDSPHVLGSSVPSRQSSLSSHIRDSRIHFPSSHRTMPGVQGAMAHTAHVSRAHQYPAHGGKHVPRHGEVLQSINSFLGSLSPSQGKLGPRKTKYSLFHTWPRQVSPC